MPEASQKSRTVYSVGEALIHIKRKSECDHDFQGWREFDDGRGGERVCVKCGMGAMAHSLSLDF